jgi:Flp pilus assembly CpaE family ATPase
MTLLSGAARTPIKEKSAKPIFKSNAANFKVKDSRAPLAPSQKLMRCLVLPTGKETSSHWEALDLDIKTTVRYQRQCCLELWDSNGHSSVFQENRIKMNAYDDGSGSTRKSRGIGILGLRSGLGPLPFTN